MIRASLIGASLLLGTTAVPALAEIHTLEITAAGTITDYSGHCEPGDGAAAPPDCSRYFEILPTGIAWTLSASWTYDSELNPDYESEIVPARLMKYDLIIDTDLNYGGYVSPFDYTEIYFDNKFNFESMYSYLSVDCCYTSSFGIYDDIVGIGDFMFGGHDFAPEDNIAYLTREFYGRGWLTSMRIDGVDVMAGAGGDVVPEPATWALMLAGFGFVGSAFRRKASVQDTPTTV